jgi:hypothetical protein
MDLNYEITVSVITAVVIGLTEAIKRMGVDTKWIPLISIIISELLVVILAGFSFTGNIIITGLIIGLTANGLFSSIKTTLTK